MRFAFHCLSALALASATLCAQEPMASFTNSLGMKFVPVPGTMVLFAVHETRLSEYEAMVKASGYPWSFKPHFTQTENHPVVGISLQDALAFTNWLTEAERKEGKITAAQGYRLPTNAEWSAAAGLGVQRKETVATEDRLQETMKFPWGLQWPPPNGVANLQEKEIDGFQDGQEFTAPVGSFKPSADGLYDVAGNVWEWAWDRELRAVPVGTLRGGSWAYFRRETLVSGYLYEVPVEMRAPTVGFRCVFEDKKRTAELLAAAGAAEAKVAEEKRAELMSKGSGDSDAVKRVLKDTAATESLFARLDPKTLTPAKPDADFKNSLALEFVPVNGLKVLFGKTEVTIGVLEFWRQSAGRPPGPEVRFITTPAHPAVNVSWDEAVAFCAWLTETDRAQQLIPETARYRLPKDAEWSLAAGLMNEIGADPKAKHLSDKKAYPWGGWPPKVLSVNLDAPNIPGFQDSFAYTAPVASLAPNALGLHDLGGNVAEWCADAWPGAEAERVVRGGSWLMSSSEQLLTSARQHFATSFTRYDLGFRCVLEFNP